MTRSPLIRLALSAIVGLGLFAGTAAAAQLVGENIAGGEFNPGARNARLGWDYVYPSAAELDYAVSKHMNTIRMPIIWERLQGQLGTAPNLAEVGRILPVLQAAAARKLTVILDLHNYGQWGGVGGIGSPPVPVEAFAKIWSFLAQQLKSMPNVAFGLMNEPHGATPPNWRDAAQHAIYAIRATGARNMIVVAGVDWDGVHDWVGNAPASSAMVGDLTDPWHNMVFEAHQYFDFDNSGTHTDCRTPAAMVALLRPIETWARSVHRQVMMTEFGVGSSPACLASLDAVVGHMTHTPDVWRGWTYWAAGAWWGSYPFSIEPHNGVDAPQMTILGKWLPKS